MSAWCPLQSVFLLYFNFLLHFTEIPNASINKCSDVVRNIGCLAAFDLISTGVSDKTIFEVYKINFTKKETYYEANKYF